MYEKWLAQCLTQRAIGAGYRYCRRCWPSTQRRSGRGGGPRAAPAALPPASGPGRPRVTLFSPPTKQPPPPSSCGITHLAGLIGRPFPKCAPCWTPSPESPHSAPPVEITRYELPFSCSRCHGSSASTWCRPPHLASPQDYWATPPDTVHLSRSPSAFGLNRHRFTAPARPAAGHHGTRGPTDEGNSRPVNVGLQHPTVPLAGPPLSAAGLQLPQSFARG